MHTKGPWEAELNGQQQTGKGGGKVFKVCKTGFGGGLIADVSAWWVDTETAKENARLIAAAPDLYEALSSLLSLGIAEKFGNWEEWEEVIAARAAIAKTEGRG